MKTMQFCNETGQTFDKEANRYFPTYDFTFSTPGEFLTFRKEWKANYRTLSEEIRKAKMCRKPTKPNYDPVLVNNLYGWQNEARNEMRRHIEAKIVGKARKAAAKEVSDS